MAHNELMNHDQLRTNYVYIRYSILRQSLINNRPDHSSPKRHRVSFVRSSIVQNLLSAMNMTLHRRICGLLVCDSVPCDHVHVGWSSAIQCHSCSEVICTPHWRLSISGMILYEAMVGEPLFQNIDDDAYDAVQDGKLHSYMVQEKLLRLFQLQSFSLLEGLLDTEPETRLTSTKAEQHIWFN